MSNAQKKTSAYTSKGSFALNKQRKIQRHLKKMAKKGSNDKQAEQALANCTPNDQPTRKASNEKMGWLKTNKSLGELIRSKFIGGVTKEQSELWAQHIKLSKKLLFWLTPTLVIEKDKEPVLVMKHTNKLSNFAGKITPRTKALKAA